MQITRLGTTVNEFAMDFELMEAIAFSEAFKEDVSIPRQRTEGEVELGDIWAQIHPNAATGIAGTLEEIESTLGVLRRFSEMKIADYGDSSNREEGSALSRRIALGKLANRFVEGANARLAEQALIDTDQLADNFYAYILSRPV